MCFLLFSLSFALSLSQSKGKIWSVQGLPRGSRTGTPWWAMESGTASPLTSLLPGLRALDSSRRTTRRINLSTSPPTVSAIWTWRRTMIRSGLHRPVVLKPLFGDPQTSMYLIYSRASTLDSTCQLINMYLTRWITSASKGYNKIVKRLGVPEERFEKNWPRLPDSAWVRIQPTALLSLLSHLHCPISITEMKPTENTF